MNRTALNVVMIALMAGGCTGQIGDPTSPLMLVPAGDGGFVVAHPDAAMNGPDAMPMRNYGPENPTPATRFPRLSHEQWENTTRDLLGLTARSGLTDSYLNDARSGTFDNNGSELRVGATLWADYQRGAESLAQQVTASAQTLARFVPAGLPSDPAMRARAFVTAFGQRAFRRPLTDSEITRYAMIYAQGTMLFTDVTDAHTAGVRIVVQAMLQSPHFLYRVEQSRVPDGEVFKPTPWELASRLSYALWNTMPDETLFRAAANNELSSVENVRTQVQRMLDDPRSRDAVQSFHDQLLAVDRYLDINRPTDRFPEFSPSLRQSMVGETRAFVRHVVFDANGSLEELLTAPYSFLDEGLARVYGVAGITGSELRRTMLDPTRRAGLFTMIGFLATNAQGADTDPIHRGVFINHHWLCAPLPPPPNNVPALPPPMGRVTMRQRISAHTGVGTCGEGCHSTMINPVGFAFERYDALGRWRETDNELPIDSSDRYAFEGMLATFDGGPDFARKAVQQRMTHRCYTRHWYEYAYGRPPSNADAPVIDRVTDRSLYERISIRSLLVELVTSRAFLTRSQQEVGP